MCMHLCLCVRVYVCVSVCVCVCVCVGEAAERSLAEAKEAAAAAAADRKAAESLLAQSAPNATQTQMTVDSMSRQLAELQLKVSTTPQHSDV
jgi:hypothetical protein